MSNIVESKIAIKKSIRTNGIKYLSFTIVNFLITRLVISIDGISKNIFKATPRKKNRNIVPFLIMTSISWYHCSLCSRYAPIIKANIVREQLIKQAIESVWIIVKFEGNNRSIPLLKPIEKLR